MAGGNGGDEVEGIDVYCDIPALTRHNHLALCHDLCLHACRWGAQAAHP